MNPLRIFLSYGHDEYAAMAERLKCDLEAAGHTVWYDKDRMVTGQPWEEYITEGLHLAAHDPATGLPDQERGRVLLLMTPHSVGRLDGYCHKEIEQALALGLRFVPVMLVDVEPPEAVKELHYLDLCPAWPPADHPEIYREKLERLLRDLQIGQFPAEYQRIRLLRHLPILPCESDLQRHPARLTGREWLFEKVDAWLTDAQSRPILWLKGAPGSGKSAIAAHFAGSALALHFCAADLSARHDPWLFTLSLAGQLASRLDAYAERLSALNLPQVIARCEGKPSDLFATLIAGPLAAASSGASSDAVSSGVETSCLLVIDALDEAARLAEFLIEAAPLLPVWLRLLVTARVEAPAKDWLQSFTQLEIGGEPNQDDLQLYFTEKLAALYPDGEKLSQAVKVLVERSGGLFLYARLVTDELLSGELSPARPEDFPRGLDAVFLQYTRRSFPRLENYQARICPALEALAAMVGAPTPEFLAKLFDWDERQKREFLKSLGSLWEVRDGLLRPFHRAYLEWLVKEGSSAYELCQQDGHALLAEAGWKEYKAREVREMDEYFLAVLPLHLLEGGRKGDAAALLGDLRYIERAYDEKQFDLLACWAIAEHAGLQKGAVYRKALNDPGGCDPDQLCNLAFLLMLTGEGGLAEGIWAVLIDDFRRLGDPAGLQACLGNQALIFMDRGELDEALRLLQEQEANCRRLGDSRGLSASLGNQALIFKARGELDEALRLQQEQEAICRRLGDPRGLSASLGNQALIFKARGELDEAMRLHKEEEAICRRLGDPAGLSASLGNQAVLLAQQGRVQAGIDFAQQALQIAQEHGYAPLAQQIEDMLDWLRRQRRQSLFGRRG